MKEGEFVEIAGTREVFRLGKIAKEESPPYREYPQYLVRISWYERLWFRINKWIYYLRSK